MNKLDIIVTVVGVEIEKRDSKTGLEYNRVWKVESLDSINYPNLKKVRHPISSDTPISEPQSDLHKDFLLTNYYHNDPPNGKSLYSITAHDVILYEGRTYI